jgi:hypothetical protein
MTAMISTDATASSFVSQPFYQMLERIRRQHQQPPPPQQQEYSPSDDDTEELQHRIQTYCMQWRERLHQCVTNYNHNSISQMDDDNSIDYDDNNTSSCHRHHHNHSSTHDTQQSWQFQYQKYTNFYMELYSLEQELQQLRQLLLLDHRAVPHLEKNDNATMMMIVIEDECDKCQDLLHKTRHTTHPKNPKGTTDVVPFLFYKYRLQQQQARNRTSSLHPDSPPSQSDSSPETSNVSTTTTSSCSIDSMPSMTIEHRTNETICIDIDGKVQCHHHQIHFDSEITMRQQATHGCDWNPTTPVMMRNVGTKQDNNMISDHLCALSKKISSQTIVIRNLRHCHIQL